MENVVENELKQSARTIRNLTAKCIGNLGVGHIGGSLDLADLLAVLYFKQMNVDPARPRMEGRDRLICSKGHAGPAIYSALAAKGYFPEEELLTLNLIGTNLPSHCDMNRTTGIDMTTGSLGQGISCAAGIALGSKLKGDNAWIYAIVGDGECEEGQCWEAFMSAAHYKLDHFVVFVDNNRMQIDGTTDEVIGLPPLEDKLTSFGFHVQTVDGHDVAAIDGAIECAKSVAGKPSAIVLNTIKGKGISFVEAVGIGNHNMPFTMDDFHKAEAELTGKECARS